MNTTNLEVYQDEVSSILYSQDGDKPKVYGIATKLGETFHAKKVIITTGTFLKGVVHIGEQQLEAGSLLKSDL